MNALRWLPVALLAAFLAPIGYLLLWTTLMAYDDTGYVLYSINTYIELGGLYEKVYTQYGPFFYVWNHGLHALTGMEFDHLTARWMTLAHWMIAAVACGLIVARLTRSPAATAVTIGAVFLHLWPMASEPAHPGGIITAMVALGAWVGTHPRASAHLRASLLGAIGAALLLTKINVGIFFFAGAGAWWLLASEAGERQPWLRGVLFVTLAAIPTLVMHGLLGTHWVNTFALVTGLSAFGIACVAPIRHEACVPVRGLLAWIAAALAVVIGTLLAVRESGTGWLELWEGVFRGPLRHPLAYSAAVRWRPGAAVLALLSFAVLIWARRMSEEERRPYVIGMRSAGAFVALLSLFMPGFHTLAFAVSYAPSLAPWFAIPLRKEDPTSGTRSWLGLLFATQILHAFPVAGSQISWGTFLWVPLAVLGIYDAARSLPPAVCHLRTAHVRRATSTIVVGLVLFASLQLGQMGWSRFKDSSEVALPGVETVRVPERHASALRVVAANAAAHADVLFTLPGMMSFHTWTSVPPPTSRNATHWFTLLDAEAQESIRRRLEASPRPGVIVQRSVYDHLLRTDVATESPLTQWLHANFESAFSIETYEFWLRKGRTIAALNTARFLESASGESPRYKVELMVASTALRAVTSVALAQLEGDDSRELISWGSGNARVEITPVGSNGVARGPTRSVNWPFDAASLLKVDILTDEMPAGLRPGSTILYFRDVEGLKLGEARAID